MKTTSGKPDQAPACEVLYHYTVGAHIENVLQDDAIRLSAMHLPKGERRIVWFSSNPEWK